MVKISGPKDYAGGRWSWAKYKAFIIAQLRNGSRKWPPINDVKKKANTRRGFYLCACCKEEIPTTIVEDGKRIKNVYVDHILPIVDPSTGFVDFDTFARRLFCEEENLQVLCKACHDKKSKEERDQHKERRAKEK